MGTETKYNFYHLHLQIQDLVKLNNPLMGTETAFWMLITVALFCFVKLNNPLMGTETVFTYSSHTAITGST